MALHRWHERAAASAAGIVLGLRGVPCMGADGGGRWPVPASSEELGALLEAFLADGHGPLPIGARSARQLGGAWSAARLKARSSRASGAAGVTASGAQPSGAVV